ncbi:hypothetical protein OBBRIDRAFT_360920 [Obba rivulosa]|uniref:Protein kinase domain-containing protein n=1 Tax=Obba rivulosa TaxID=1052685 RepID=A0A8E2DU89_9APHY|nr:hypothetical protein OBBRIDRAFT_360920 [Obba rivulosa]
MPLRQSVTNALPDGWRVASIDIRHEVKRTIVKAYTDLHTRGIMHGNVRLDNILLHDNQVTLVSLESAATIYRRKGSNLPLCSEADLEEEMLKLKHLLRYEDDRLLDHASEETVGSEDLAKVAWTCTTRQ